MKYRARKAFERIYPAGKTSGSSFQEVRQVMIEKGFNPATHTTLSYASMSDMYVVSKILSGIDAPFVPPLETDFLLGTIKQTCLQPVNVFGIIRNMLGGKAKKFSLSDVYRTLYGMEDVVLHRANGDTLLLLDFVLHLREHGLKG